MARNRSTVLDVTSVRRYAAALGIHHKHEFVAKFDEYHNLKDGSSTTPANAWDGIKIENSRLQDVAMVLGLSSFRHLMLHEQSMQWSILLQNTALQQDFIDFEPFDDEVDEWRSIDFAAVHQRKTDELQPVAFNCRWQLILEGEPGDCFALFMQTDLHITQLMPLEDDGFSGRLEDEYCYYLPPEPRALFTDKEGFGWRRFIAIRAKNIPLAQLGSNHGKALTAHELELFAERVQAENDGKLAIDFYEFVLADTRA